MGLFHHCKFCTTKSARKNFFLEKYTLYKMYVIYGSFDSSLQRVKFNCIAVIKYQITWLHKQKYRKQRGCAAQL
jgi:hypothetical protein